MNSLKRILCVVLCGVMLLGMLAVGAAASGFTDSDKISNREAVDILAALKIINGKEDGSYFDPGGTVTRAEMAKMICVALNGGKDPLLGAFQSTYRDTANHWAASYIEYCTRLGIVSGRGNGLFDPNASVTGAECAKMLLAALGYDAAEEGFIGVNWSIPVNIRANETELYAQLEHLTPSAGLSRDDAAQMVYNTIGTSMVAYEYRLVTVNGVLTTVAAAHEISPVQTILTSKYKAAARCGVLTGISGSSLQITADARSGSISASYTELTTDYAALLGQYVKVLSTADGAVIGVVAAGENKTVSTAVNTVTNDAGKVKFGGVSYVLNNGTPGSVTVLLDGVGIGSKTAAYFVSPLSYNDVAFIDNNSDGRYEVAVVTTHTPEKVNYLSSAELIAGGVSYPYKDNHITGNPAKGDCVTVTANLFENCKDIHKIEPVTGKISGYRNQANDEYLIGGVWYLANGTLPGVAPGDTAEIIAVNGIIYSAKKADTATLDNVAMVLAIDPPTALVRNAKLLLSDGTKKIVTVEQGSAGLVIPVPGALYVYTETDYGCRFQAAAAAAGYAYAAAPAVAAAGTTVETINGTGILDTAVIFVWDAASSTGKVITGAQLNTLALGSAISAGGIGSYTAVVGGLNRIVMAAVATGTDGVLPIVGNPANRYGLIVDSAYQNSADTITYKLWDGASVLTVKEENVSAMAARTQKSLIRYSAVSDGVIRDAAPAGESRGAVIGMLGGQISFDGTSMKDLTSDTVYMYYDSSTDSPAAIGRIDGRLIRADEIEGVYLENVKYILDGGDVAFLLIDVNNRLSDATAYPVTLADTSPDAAVVFRDAYGRSVASGDTLPAGTFLNVTISAAAADSVELIFSGAVYCSGSGESYASGDDIALRSGDVVTMTFVMSGAASVTLQDAS